MKIKHVLASSKDKKATIQSTEMAKLLSNNLGINSNFESKIILYYHEFECTITYHRSRNGYSWYADTCFPKNSYLPKVGEPKYFDVDLVVFANQFNGLSTLFNNEDEEPIVPMSLDGEFQPIRDWADHRGIYEKGDIKTQYIKLCEEIGELGKAILQNNKAEVIDAIGDSVVVLTNLSELASNHFRNNCKTCNAEGGYFEDIAGDGGSKMWQPCNDCYGFTIEDCINSAYEVIAKRQGKMINGTFVKETK